MSIRKKEEKNSKILLILILFVIITYFNFRDIIFSKGVIGLHSDWDLPPFSEQFLEAFKLYMHSWIASRDFGIVSIAPVSFTGSPNCFLSLLMYLLALLGMDGGMISKIICILALFLMALTTYLLCRRFGLSSFASFFAAIFYMNTPMVFDRIAIGHPYFLFDIALFPLALYVAFSEIPLVRKSILSGIIITAGSNNAATFFIFLYVFIIYYVINLILKGDRLKLRECILSICIISLIYVSLYAYWTIPVLYDLASGTSHTILAQQMTFLPVSWTVDSIPYTDAARLLTTSNRYFGDTVRSSILWKYLGFFPMITTLSILLLKRRDPRIIFFFILIITGFIISTGGGKWVWMIEHIPPLAIYRDASKWTLLISLGYAFFIGVACELSERYVADLSSGFLKKYSSEN